MGEEGLEILLENKSWTTFALGSPIIAVLRILIHFGKRTYSK